MTSRRALLALTAATAAAPMAATATSKRSVPRVIACLTNNWTHTVLPDGSPGIAVEVSVVSNLFGGFSSQIPFAAIPNKYQLASAIKASAANVINSMYPGVIPDFTADDIAVFSGGELLAY